MDDGYGDVAYIGFRFVYAAATAAGSGIYSTTGAGGVIYKKKKQFGSIISFLLLSTTQLLFYLGKKNLLGPCWNSIDVVAVVIAVVYALTDTLIKNHVIEFYTVVLVVAVWHWIVIMHLAIHLVASPIDQLRRNMSMPVQCPNN